jgi:hypothetical protein
MRATIFVIGYRFPDRPWQWTMSMAVGQAVALAIASHSLSLRYSLDRHNDPFDSSVCL